MRPDPQSWNDLIPSGPDGVAIDLSDPQVKQFVGTGDEQWALYGPTLMPDPPGLSVLWCSMRYDPTTHGLSISIAPPGKRVDACEQDLRRFGVAHRVGLSNG